MHLYIELCCGRVEPFKITGNHTIEFDIGGFHVSPHMLFEPTRHLLKKVGDIRDRACRVFHRQGVKWLKVELFLKALWQRLVQAAEGSAEPKIVLTHNKFDGIRFSSQVAIYLVHPSVVSNRRGIHHKKVGSRIVNVGVG